MHRRVFSVVRTLTLGSRAMAMTITNPLLSAIHNNHIQHSRVIAHCGYAHGEQYD